MNALRAGRLTAGLYPHPITFARSLPVLNRTLPSTRRTYFFDPIFLPAQEALLSIHSFTGIPWYLLIPTTGILHTLIFRMPATLLSRRNREKILHGTILAQAVRAAAIRAHLDARIAGVVAPLMVSRAYKKLGKMPAEMNPMKSPTMIAATTVSLVSWFWSISLFRRLTGGMSIWGTRLGEPDVSMTTEGALWFQDLTASDPTYILPLFSTGMIVYSWVPKTRAGWMAVLGKENPKEPSGMTPIRIKLVRLSMVATPMLIAGFDSLTAGSSFFVVSSLLSYRAMRSFDKKDPLTGRSYEELAKLITSSTNTTMDTVKKKPGKALQWYIRWM